MPAIIIPARLRSLRLPNKLLLNDTGFPLLWHTIKRALESKLASVVLVATEDDEIADVVDQFNGKNVYCVRTPYCNSGTERIAWIVENNEEFSDYFDYVVNFQGDEPELPGVYADSLINELQKNNTLNVVTIAAIGNKHKYKSSSVVKVVIDHYSNAMYFSRSPIPYGSDGDCLVHIGIYAFKREFLMILNSLQDTTLYNEKLEQLQWLQNGFKIKILHKNVIYAGVDTKIEYDEFVQRYRENII